MNERISSEINLIIRRIPWGVATKKKLPKVVAQHVSVAGSTAGSAAN
jgi:hypothetical protein